MIPDSASFVPLLIEILVPPGESVTLTEFIPVLALFYSIAIQCLRAPSNTRALHLMTPGCRA